jgi:hypothetical protein
MAGRLAANPKNQRICERGNENMMQTLKRRPLQLVSWDLEEFDRSYKGWAIEINLYRFKLSLIFLRLAKVYR